MAGQPLDDMARWAWASAGVKGTSHVKTGVRLQDSFCNFEVEKNTGNVFCGMVHFIVGVKLRVGWSAIFILHAFRKVNRVFDV